MVSITYGDRLMPLTITAKPVLNKVDQVVKAVMLTYPVSYKSRMSVLKGIFLDGGSLGFDADGCPDMSHFGSLSAEMDFSDLDIQREKAEADLAGDNSPAMATFYAGRAVALKRQYADRELVAAYIDILAVEHTHGEDHPSDASLIDVFRMGAANILHDVPFDAMDKEWAFAAEEVVTAARDGIACQLGMPFKHFTPERADPQLLQIHGLLTGYLDRLDVITGTKATLASLNELSDSLIAEVLAEGKGLK